MSNEKTIDERIAELPDNVKQITLPKEGLPKEFEKYAGKPITEILKSQMETQANYTKGQQEKATVEKLLEEFQNTKQGMEEKLAELTKKTEREPETNLDEEYEYVTRSDVKKTIEDTVTKILQSHLQERPALTQKEVVDTVRTQKVIDKFMDKHPELNDDDVDSIIQFGISKQAKSLEEAYEKYTDLAKRMGLNSGKNTQTHVVPNMLAGGADNEPAEGGSRFDSIVKRANKTRMSSIITPVSK